MCSLIASVEDGKVVRIQGDPDQPYTAGFACGKVNRDSDLVNSPERIRTPLKRSGPKGSGQFTAITWDQALDEISTKWKAIIEESGPLALLGYAYSAHQGLMNRGLVNGLFHALGASRLQAGTVCDTCCETAWDMTLGPVGGADPEDVVHSDLVISWGADLAATNVHFWALALLIKDDYAAAGVPMLPVVKGDRVTVIQIGVYMVATIVATFVPLFFPQVGWIYGISALVLNLILIRSFYKLWKNMSERTPASGLFHYSMLYLAILFLMFAIDRVVVMA